jgi:hypothetical protein
LKLGYPDAEALKRGARQLLGTASGFIAALLITL